MAFHVPEKYRVTKGQYGTSARDGNNGHFDFQLSNGVCIHTVASDGLGWEHVSVSLSHHHRCPWWPEMMAVKRLFWDDDDWVVEYHPAQTAYVNCHPYCLHLWRPVGEPLPTPPSYLVGPLRGPERTRR